MSVQPESARDKQILTFGRRQRVIEAAIHLARELVHDEPLTIAEEALVKAVREYQPKRLPPVNQPNEESK